MSSRKIIFFVIVGLVGFILLYGIWNLSQARKTNKAATTETLTLWVVGNTTQQYETLFSGFEIFAPEYKNTSLDIRVFPDYDGYQKVLLSTLAEGNGPDIFMIE
jgi:maltose-binding protein MalE